jgi:hypothetical protein
MAMLNRLMRNDDTNSKFFGFETLKWSWKSTHKYSIGRQLFHFWCKNDVTSTFCLFFCTFSFGHFVFCSSSIYGFWLPLYYLQTLLNIIVKVLNVLMVVHMIVNCCVAIVWHYTDNHYSICDIARCYFRNEHIKIWQVRTHVNEWNIIFINDMPG